MHPYCVTKLRSSQQDPVFSPACFLLALGVASLRDAGRKAELLSCHIYTCIIIGVLVFIVF